MLKFIKSIYFLFFVSICLTTNALTLNEALINAYKTNPELNAKREDLKSADEQIMQALSRWLPSVKLQSNKQYTESKKLAQEVNPNTNIPTGIVGSRASDGVAHDLTIKQNLFRSGADIAGMQAAHYSIKRARALLEDVEQDVLLKVVKIYMATLQEEENYRIALESEKDSGKILQSVSHRFKAGDVSKTDVELAKAGASKAKAARLTALANYEAYKANLEAIVGVLPNNLSLPKNDISIPKSLSETLDMSMLKNPDMVATKNAAEAEKKNIDVQRGAVLPSVELSHNINDDTQWGYSSSRPLRNHTTSIVLNVPIFAVGEWSQLRAQKRKSAAAQSTLASVTDSTRAGALQAWGALKAQKESLQAQEDEYKARKAVYTGAQAQEKHGHISTIDLINFKDDYFKTYAQYLRARSEYYNALYGLKAIVGECTAKGLGLDVKYYDPLKNYDSIKWQLIGAF